MSDLPKHFHGGRVTKAERAALEAWEEEQGWSREKTLTASFEHGDQMPRILCVPGLSPLAWQRGKCVCVMCGYVTTVTNLCRQCPETPADEICTTDNYCYAHRTIHRHGDLPATHRTIGMVAVRDREKLP